MRYTKIILALALFGFRLSASSQCTDPDACNTGINTVDEICLSLEEVTFHDGTIPELGGMTTYRLYLNFPNEGTGVQHSLVAVASQPITSATGWEATNTVEITTTTSFYQDQFGSNTSGGINSDLYSTFPTLEFDSWISLGGTNQNEGEVSILSDPNISPGWISDFEAGGNIVVPVSATGGSWYTIPTGANVNLGYSLLLGQFTTDGIIEASFYNILVKTDLNGNGILDDGGLAEGGSTSLYNMSLANNPCTSVASPCVYADDGLNCDGTCINDADGDGVCDEFEVAGCTDVSACNYNPDVLVTDSDQSLCDFSCIDTGSFASEPCENETSFDYDGQTYSLVEIDGICWFAEDLRTTSYNNGNPIDVVTDEVTWAALTEADGPKSTYLTDGNGQVYRSYNWYAVETGLLCPSGWHVANNADWNSLEKEAFNARPNKLSRRSNMVLGNVQDLYNLGWFSQYNQSNVFASTGFSGGLRENVSGKWREDENSIYWWTFEDFTPRSDEGFRFNSAWSRGVMANGAWERSNALWSTSNNKNNALRVRCVKGGVETGGLPEGSFYSVYISPGTTSIENYDVGQTYNVGDTLYQDTTMQNPYSYGFKVSNDYGERLVTDRNGVLILDPDTLFGEYGGGGGPAHDPVCAYCVQTYSDGNCFIVEKCVQNPRKKLGPSEICAQFDLPAATATSQNDCSWGVWVGVDQEKIAKYELTSKLARIGYRLGGEGKSLDGTRVDILPFDVESNRRKENTVSNEEILKANHFIQIDGLYFRFIKNNGEDFLRLEISPIDDGATLPQQWDDINIFTEIGQAKPGELCSCYRQIGNPPACECWRMAQATTKRHGDCPSVCQSYSACTFNCCDPSCGVIDY